MKLFENFGLSHELMRSIKDLGFANPTQIQEESIPHIIEGKDVIGESATGSGKTLAFGCGIVEKVFPGKGVQALVLTPTRELAEQVKDSLKQMAYHKRLRTISIYGGVSINPQIDDLQVADVVVATPGRLLDHMERGTINLSNLKVLVLDEADRMFDMGFIEDIEDIIRACPKERQTLFFSATISHDIQRFVDRYMINPVRASAMKQVDPAKLKQVYYDVLKHQKLSLLTNLLQKENAGLAMIFCNTRSNTDFVVRNLRANKLNAVAIHGGLSQNKRTKTISMFNDAKVNVLVCTDVAARGLHIENVSHIYNYDIPKEAKDYVHRIGRTARAGEEGKVVNLLSNHDHDNYSRILREYREFEIHKEEIPFLKKIQVRLDRPGPRGGMGGRGNFGGRSRFGQREGNRGRYISAH